MNILSPRSLLLLVLIPVAASLSTHAADPVVSFESDTQRERYERMLEEYRCLKCQNQNLAGSNAALAGDLRREIREQILDGADDKSIDTYLVARYGEFVRYRPRFGMNTLVLWLAPGVLLMTGIWAGIRLARRGSDDAVSDLAAGMGASAGSVTSAGGGARTATSTIASPESLAVARSLLRDADSNQDSGADDIRNS